MTHHLTIVDWEIHLIVDILNLIRVCSVQSMCVMFQNIGMKLMSQSRLQEKAFMSERRPF